MKVELRMRNSEWEKPGRSVRRVSFPIPHSPFRIRSFTLIELLLVLALLSLLASMTVVRLDSFTDEGKLQSAAFQIEAAIHTAQLQAQTSGVPRQIQYASRPPSMVVRKPKVSGHGWEWDEGVESIWPTGVTLENVLFASEAEPFPSRDFWSLRISGDGRFPEHAVVLALHDRRAIAILNTFEPRTILLSQPVDYSSWSALVASSEKKRASP